MLAFTFTIADKVNEVTFQRSERDVVKELRLKLANTSQLIFDLQQENRMLRIFLHQDKAKLYALVDAVYRANIALREKNIDLRRRLEGKYWDIFQGPLRSD